MGLMRVRAQDSVGDYLFGHGTANFFIDSIAMVKQLIETRLRLMEGEWFLDVTEGTPYSTSILGVGTKGLYDFAIQQQILDTPGVQQIATYSSSFDPATRRLTVTANVDSIYGTIPVSVAF
jgi:hypothetical protein